MLTVIKKDEEKSLLKKKQFYLCKCDCGKLISVQPYEIINGRIISCGCSRNKNKFKDIAGERFGKLVAIKYAKTINKKAYWICECDCGNITVVSQSNLNNGHTKSCGCLKYSDVSNLAKHFRNLLKKIIIETLEKSNYKCYITGKTDNLEVHHKISFNELYKKAIIDSGFQIYDDIKKYTKEELKIIDNKFLELHQQDILVVLHKDVHRKFHKIYGYKNNTIQQFSEFVDKYFS